MSHNEWLKVALFGIRENIVTNMISVPVLCRNLHKIRDSFLHITQYDFITRSNLQQRQRLLHQAPTANTIYMVLLCSYIWDKLNRGIFILTIT